MDSSGKSAAGEALFRQVVHWSFTCMLENELLLDEVRFVRPAWLSLIDKVFACPLP